MQLHSFHFTLVKIVSLDYYATYNGLAQATELTDYFITYCIFLTASVLFVILLVVHYKEHINIFWIQVVQYFYCGRVYTMYLFHTCLTLYYIFQELQQLHQCYKKYQSIVADQILKEVLPPPDEYITQFTEQLTIYQVLKETLPLWDEYIM